MSFGYRATQRGRSSTTPAMAFCQMAGDAATGLDIQGVESMIPTKWEDWLELPVRDGEARLQSPRSGINGREYVIGTTHEGGGE